MISDKSSEIIARIDHVIEVDWSGTSGPDVGLFVDVQNHIYFLESEIAQLKKACGEWSDVSQRNYQKAKAASLALEVIKSVVKATSTNGETE